MSVTTQSITLRDERGGWLAQVLLTSDGMFAAVSEFGNYAFAWRSFGEDFNSFLIQLNVEYFADKMSLGLSYSYGSTDKTRKAALVFSKQVLPKLQAHLKNLNSAA